MFLYTSIIFINFFYELKEYSIMSFTRRAFMINTPIFILSTKNVKNNIVNCNPANTIQKWETSYKMSRVNENFYKASRKYYESLLANEGHMSKELVDSFKTAREIAQQEPDNKVFQEMLKEMKNEVLDIRIFDNCLSI
jgi:uncharacterized membrane-anchored protein YjiN (DUF445 family)